MELAHNIVSLIYLLQSDGSPDNIDYLDTWKGMEEARQLGLTRSIGISNFNASQVDRLVANSQVRPAVNEFEVSEFIIFIASH